MFTPENCSPALQYQQWQSIDNRVDKLTIKGTVGECFKELKYQLESFLLHTYIKRKQSTTFKALIKKCDGKNIVLQVDFSENAAIATQREIQAAHRNHCQVTLFTAHAWIKHDSVSCSMVMVSDELSHTKPSVYIFMQHIFSHIKTLDPLVEQIHIFSDGASSQFKQKFLFSNLHGWENEHDVKIKWNFFATSHGKGEVDGIGGTINKLFGGMKRLNELA